MSLVPCVRAYTTVATIMFACYCSGHVKQLVYTYVYPLEVMDTATRIFV